MTLRESNEVIIAFAVDDKYAAPLCVAIQSIKETCNPKRIYRMFVLYNSLSLDNRALIESMGGSSTPVQCIGVSHLVDEQVMYDMAYFSRTMYFRMLIPEVLAEYEKVLYLDCDVAALKDVGKLYDTDIGGAVIGGIRELYEKGNLRRIRNTTKYKLKRYINSGVLLIDCKRYRAEDVKEQCYNFLRENRQMSCPDQDAINIACMGKLKYLDKKWNVFYEDYIENEENIAILHFASSHKPWNSLKYKGAAVFWRYAEHTPVYEQLCSGIFDNQRNTIINSSILDIALIQCREGGTGLRYILDLAKAWLNFKLHREIERTKYTEEIYEK